MEHKIKNWVLGLLFAVLPFITEAGYDDCVRACKAQKTGEGIACDRSFIQDVSDGKLTIRVKSDAYLWRLMRKMMKTEGDEIIVLEGTLSDYRRMITNNDKFILTEKRGSYPPFDSDHLAEICYYTEVCRDKYDCEIVILGTDGDYCRSRCK